MSMFGLLPHHIQAVQLAISRFPDIEKVVVFGSRAMGNFKTGSDVDLALYGHLEPTTLTDLSRLLNEEGTLPYKFDLVEYATISEPALKAHIDSVGQVLL